MQISASCYNHIQNNAYILCTGSCLKERPWICESCIEVHNKIKIENVEYLDPLTHAKDKAEFQLIKMYLIEDINKRPLKLQFLLKGYQKIQDILYRILNYIQQNQKNMQEYVDDYLKRIKEDLKFVQQLSFESINREQAEQINKIRQSRFINPQEYYKGTLRRDLYKLIDLYKDALQQTETQVRDYFKEQPQSLQQQQNRNTERIVNTTCISLSHDEFYLASGTCGSSLGRLDIFEILSLNRIVSLQFKGVITTVSFNQKPTNQKFIYELAVCTKKQIQYYVFNIQDKTIKLKHQIQFNYEKYGQMVKFIFLNQYKYIVIGDKQSYFQNSSLQQQDQIIDTITVTDIDVSLNHILIGNKQGFVKFQEFEQNDIFSLNQHQQTQAHDRQPVVCVKIRQANNNQQQTNVYLTAGQDDLIKIWNFQSHVISQIKIKCNTACFVGNSNLIAIFNKKEFEIGVFYDNDDEDENNQNNENKQSYERIKSQPLNFDKDYLKNTKTLQNIGIVLVDNCFIQTITRDNLVQRYLDDATICLKFQKKQGRQPLEISLQDTQLRWSRQPSIQQEIQKQI